MRITYILLAFFISKYSQAQDSLPLELGASYVSTLVHPGIQVGVSKPFAVKEKKNGSVRMRMINGKLLWYHHKTFHNNLNTLVGVTQRRVYQSSFFTHAFFNIGYSITTPAATVYQVSDNGEVQTTRPLYHHFASELGFGVGYDLNKKKQSPLKLHFDVSLLNLMPFNSFFVLRPVATLGIKTDFSIFGK